MREVKGERGCFVLLLFFWPVALTFPFPVQWYDLNVALTFRLEDAG